MQLNVVHWNSAVNIEALVSSTILLACSKYDKINDQSFSFIVIMQGLYLGLLLYVVFASVSNMSSLIGINLCIRCMIFIGCLRYNSDELYSHSVLLFMLYLLDSGLRRSMMCMFNGYQAKKYAREKQLFRNRTADHGDASVVVLDRNKNGIPERCGFDFPILSLLFTIVLIALTFWTSQID
jgi:hypothetical protein